MEVLPVGVQAKALEPIDQVVSKKDELEVILVRSPIFG